MKVLLIHDRKLELPLDGTERPEAHAVGGVEIYLLGLARGLLAQGHQLAEIRFVERCDDPEARGGARRGHRVRASGTIPRPLPIRELMELVRREEPDLVHLHSPHYAIHPLALRYLAWCRPTVLTQHDVTPICFKHTKLRRDGRLCDSAVGWRCLAERCYLPGTAAPLLADGARLLNSPLRLRAMRRLTRIIAPSRYLRDELVRNGFAAQQVAVLPNFSVFDRDPTPPPNRRRILFVGRLAPEKGIGALLSALPLLRTPGWELTVIGSGPLADVVQRAREDCEKNGRIDFLGDVPHRELPAHYRSANIVVVPSLIPESFGLVGVEAMAFGRPVVAFGAGGVVEWLEHERTGLIAEHGDIGQLAAQLDRLLTAPGMQRQFGANGAARVAERFTPAAHIAALIPIYKKAINGFAAGQAAHRHVGFGAGC